MLLRIFSPCKIEYTRKYCVLLCLGFNRINQVGHGLPCFSGARYQQGYGLANIFSSIAKTVLLLVKSGTKPIGKQILHSGVGFASDVLSGKNAKQAVIDRAKVADSNLLKAATRKRKARSQKTRV